MEEWTRLMRWLEDRRTALEASTWQLISQKFYQRDLGIPNLLQKEIGEQIGSLLTREVVNGDTPVPIGVQTSEIYGGSEQAKAHLINSLFAVGDEAGYFLGTDEAFWPNKLESVGLTPPPPSKVVVHLNPSLPSQAELLEQRRRWYRNKRMLIIGGQIESRVIDCLVDEVGVDRGHLEWLPSERNKKARNIDAKIGGLPKNAVVICLWGKVGHDVSGKVESACKKGNLTMHLVEYATHLREYLSDLPPTVPVGIKV